MPIPIGLLLTTALLVPAPAAPVSTSDTAVAQGPQNDPGGSATPTERPHSFGLGGFGGSAGGASFRYFATDRLGVDLDVGWTGNSVGGPSGGSTFRVAPSMVFMFTKANQLADIDWRPYAGVGFNWAYSGQVLQQSSTNQLRTSGLGMQAFGGVELTFAGARNISISAQVAYYRLAVQPVNLLSTGGTDFYLLFHYYMK